MANLSLTPYFGEDREKQTCRKGSHLSSVIGPHVPVGDLVGNNGCDKKRVEPNMGHTNSNTNWRIPASFFGKSFNQSMSEEAKKTWLNKIHHSKNID